MTLPSDYEDMERYIEMNKVILMEKVVSSISYAVEHDLPNVEVFKFKNSDFIVVLERNMFINNLDNIYDYYIQNEIYECCGRVIKLKQLINNPNYNEQKKRYKPKGSSKRKN